MPERTRHLTWAWDTMLRHGRDQAEPRRRQWPGIPVWNGRDWEHHLQRVRERGRIPPPVRSQALPPPTMGARVMERLDRLNDKWYEFDESAAGILDDQTKLEKDVPALRVEQAQ